MSAVPPWNGTQAPSLYPYLTPTIRIEQHEVSVIRPRLALAGWAAFDRRLEGARLIAISYFVRAERQLTQRLFAKIIRRGDWDESAPRRTGSSRRSTRMCVRGERPGDAEPERRGTQRHL